MTPYDIAILRGYKEVAEFLKGKGGKTGISVSDKSARIICKTLRMVAYKIRRPTQAPAKIDFRTPTSRTFRFADIIKLRGPARITSILRGNSPMTTHLDVNKSPSLLSASTEPPSRSVSSPSSSSKHDTQMAAKSPNPVPTEVNPVSQPKIPSKGSQYLSAGDKIKKCYSESRCKDT